MAWASFAVLSFVLALTTIWAGRAGTLRRNDLNVVQAMHLRRTSRFGGLAVLVIFALGGLIGPTRGLPQIWEYLACVLPLFLVGIAEDAGWRVAPRWRLVAGICASLLAILVYGTIIQRLGFSGLDFVLEQRVVAIVLTVVALTGVSQSFNLMDGLHGLCGFCAMIIAAALAVISAKGGQGDVVQMLALMGAALVGFLVLNFPRGLLFLGDAGATAIGFILSCIAVNMLQMQPDLSPWALVLVFFWPIADTILTMARRMARHRPPMKPDRMHFHHVVMRGFEILVLRKKHRALSNPVATMILMPFIAAPSVAGVLFWNADDVALMATVASAVLFVVSYRAIVRSAQRRQKIMLAGTRRADGKLHRPGARAK